MITISQKQLEKAAKLIAAGARLNELNRLEGYVPSALTSKRKAMLKALIAGLSGKKEKTEEQREVHIRIEVPEEKTQVVKKEKSFTLSLKDILAGKFNEVEDNDDDTLTVLSGLLPEAGITFGKIIREL